MGEGLDIGQRTRDPLALRFFQLGCARETNVAIVHTPANMVVPAFANNGLYRAKEICGGLVSRRWVQNRIENKHLHNHALDFGVNMFVPLVICTPIKYSVRAKICG